MKDLKDGMLLEGVITNVTNFGAFVDIGVHQDGLVHISALSNTFVKDPHTIVKTGDVVKVKVMEVDVQRKRIGLSMRLDDELLSKADKESDSGKDTGKDRGKEKGKEKGKTSNRPNNRPAQTNSGRSASAKPAVGTFGALLQNATKAKK